ncbi:SPOR domain-containing protein [Thiomicrorhabdus sp.]|uniref:SPOR domain-containing protein n=1 Tax=Thiomicrorhabdus sp. TaxID=2039724 RepID=UPI0029C773BA|nr:SPOR domain-containing protein [Thiomicrorhabdus sp.]
MSFTISDLEKEREKILKEIESKAQQISQPLGEIPARNKEPKLGDWLKAADQVLPDKEPQVSDSSGPAMAENNDRSLQLRRKNVAYGIAVLSGTIVFTLAASLFFSHQDLQSQLSDLHQETQKQATLIQSLEEKLSEYENQQNKEQDKASLLPRMDALQAQVADLQSQFDNKLAEGKAESENSTLALLENLVNQKWQLFNQQLTGQTRLAASGEKKSSGTVSLNKQDTPDLAVKQPVAPAAPTSPQAPKIAQNPAQNWLLKQKGKDYILQLASSSNKADLERIVERKKMDKIEILPQNSKQGGLRYILVSRQAFTDKSQASEASQLIKKNFGISAWIRQFEDLSKRLPN